MAPIEPDELCPLPRLEKFQAPRLPRMSDTRGRSSVNDWTRRLREKIERDPANPTRLVTVWGVGYRYEPLEVPT